jgi:hypothetical protein
MRSSPSPSGAIVSSFIVLAQTIQEMSVTSGLWSSFIVRPTACGTVRSCPAVHDALASETRRRERRPHRVRINLPRSQKNGLNADYALRPSYFWMPQVGYGIRCYAIIFRCPALFNFAHSPDFKCRVSERKTAPTGGGRELGPSFPRTSSGGKASGIRNKRSQGSNEVCVVPTINRNNPHYPQPGTEPRRLMFEDISRRAPARIKSGRTARIQRKSWAQCTMFSD